MVKDSLVSIKISSVITFVMLLLCAAVWCCFKVYGDLIGMIICDIGAVVCLGELIVYLYSLVVLNRKEKV